MGQTGQTGHLITIVQTTKSILKTQVF